MFAIQVLERDTTTEGSEIYVQPQPDIFTTLPLRRQNYETQEYMINDCFNVIADGD